MNLCFGGVEISPLLALFLTGELTEIPFLTTWSVFSLTLFCNDLVLVIELHNTL
jgi:hypothetical protein